MASVKFYLSDPDSETETSIYLLFHYSGGKPLKYAASEKADPKKWNKKKQRIREVKNDIFSPSTNKRLDFLEMSITKVYRELVDDNKKIDNSILRFEMDVLLGKKARRPNRTLMQQLQNRFKELSDVGDKKSRDYTAVIKKLNEYALEINGGIEVSYEDISKMFMESFVSFLEGQGLSENTISKYFFYVKNAAVQAFDSGYHTNNLVNSRKLRPQVSKVKRFSIDEAEIEKVRNVDLSEFPKSYDNVRDGFIFRTYTLLRYGDYLSLKNESVRDGYIFKYTQKSSKPTLIPIHPVVKSILDKHDGLPVRYTLGHNNMILKEIFKIAEINKEVVVSQVRGGKRTEFVVPKHKIANSHFARRSGITNMKRAGIEDSVIMALSAHKTQDSYRKYIDIEQEELAEKAAQHPFFKK